MFTPEQDAKARELLARMSRAKARLEEIMPPATTPLDANRDPKAIRVDVQAWFAASDELKAATQAWHTFNEELRQSWLGHPKLK